MTQPQPEIMQVNGTNQNGSGPGTVSAQDVCIDLIAHHCRMGHIKTILVLALANAPLEWLFGMGDTGNPTCVAEINHPCALAV